MEDQHYTPETLRFYEKTLHGMYNDMLCMDEAGADPESEQFFLLAMASLEMARRYIDIATMKQAAMEERRRG